MMTQEAMVLGCDDGLLQGRRDGGERSPCQAPAMGINTKFMDRFAVAVEQLRIRRAPARADCFEARHTGPAKRHRGQQSCRGERCCVCASAFHSGRDFDRRVG
jgi:hypothetical protein